MKLEHVDTTHWHREPATVDIHAIAQVDIGLRDIRMLTIIMYLTDEYL